MIMAVSVSIFAVFASCSPTPVCQRLLEEVQPGHNNVQVNVLDKIMDKYNHLTTDSTVSDVVNKPAFQGFGQYILPLEWRYDPEMKLKDIPSLLPYHNYVDANRSLGYINMMIDMRKRGDKLFYQLDRKDAGLFY